MYIFRRIYKTDAHFKFITGNKAFDEKNPDGSLKNYLDDDVIAGGEFLTFLFIEKKNPDDRLIIGLFRYKNANKAEFFSELEKCDVDKDIKNVLIKELDTAEFSIIYLSRIGVIKNFQDMNIGQIISNFFEFLMKRNRQRTFIYLKVIEKQKSFIGPSYDFIGHNDNTKWGSYYLVSKFLKFD
jgi:hypothetical protein